METEQWRDIPGFEGWYQVSNHGRVKRIASYKTRKGKNTLKPYPNRKGYLVVRLYVGGNSFDFAVHDLVIRTFTGPRPAGTTINHCNGVKTDNTPDNLEYLTPAQHKEHTVNILGKNALPDNTGERNGMAKLNEVAVREIRQLYESGKSVTKIGEMFGVSRRQVKGVVNKTSWKHVD